MSFIIKSKQQDEAVRAAQDKQRYEDEAAGMIQAQRDAIEELRHEAVLARQQVEQQQRELEAKQVQELEMAARRKAEEGQKKREEEAARLKVEENWKKFNQIIQSLQVLNCRPADLLNSGNLLLSELPPSERRTNAGGQIRYQYDQAIRRNTRAFVLANRANIGCYDRQPN